MGRRLTREEFIKRSTEVHGYKYDYSKSVYRNSTIKTSIICRKHGEFLQSPKEHMLGKGCIKCVGRYSPTTDEWIERASKHHNNKYDYSNVVYVNNSTKVEIICPEHGSFWQTPDCHFRSNGCIKCGNIEIGLKRKARASETRNWEFEQLEDHKLIPLPCGSRIIVDNEDFDKLKDTNWYYNGFYVRRSSDAKYIHRIIMNPPEDMVVDHKNHNTLDNRKSNLRICTTQQNQWNQRPNSESRSIYKGIIYEGRKDKWLARITQDNIIHHIGYFDTEEEAARAYDLKAIELRGEWAYQTLNFPDENILK